MKDLVQYGNSGHLFVRRPSTGISPIWYMFLRKPEGARTKGWFWTPYSENTVFEGGGDRWIPVSRNPVVPTGLGPWAGCPPAEVNADLITYLATTNIKPPELEPGLKHVPMIMTKDMLAAGKFVKRLGDVEITFLCPPAYTTTAGTSILYCVPDINTNT